MPTSGRSKMKQKRIRVGVIGIGRGQSFASSAGEAVGMELVALCDTWQSKLKEVGKKYGVKTYTDYDRFLEHDMDAVFAVAQRLTVMVNGEVLESGMPEAVRASPAVQSAYLGHGE